MLLLATKAGDKIFWPIGNLEQRTFDEHPGWLVRLQHGVDDRGREGLVATVILLRTRLDGTQYLETQNILERFIEDRDWTVEDYDGKSIPDLMKMLGAQRREFFTTEVGSPTGSPIAVAAGVETDATPSGVDVGNVLD